MECGFADLVTPLLARPIGRQNRHGITVVMDKGLGLGATADLVAVAGEYIDFWKSYSNWARERARAERVSAKPKSDIVPKARPQNLK